MVDSEDGVPADTLPQYLAFIAKYGKTKQTKEEFDYRLKVFGQNYKTIVEHNAMDAPFEMEINEFADLTFEEFKAGYTGLIVPKEKTEAMKDFKFPEPELESNTPHGPIVGSSILPEKKDWYHEGFVSIPEN